MRSIVVLLCSLLVVSAAKAQDVRVTVLPVLIEFSANGTPELINDIVRGAVEDLGYRIVGAEDPRGADQMVSIKVARVITDWVVTGTVVDTRTSQVVRRSSDVIGGDGEELLEEMPDVISDLYDGRVSTQADTAPPKATMHPL